MTDIRVLQCNDCAFHGMISLCQPLNIFNKRLMTRIHGQSDVYYSVQIEKLENITTRVPCAAHSKIKSIILNSEEENNELGR